MPSIAEHVRPVTGGVDTHAEVHVAAVVDQVGGCWAPRRSRPRRPAIRRRWPGWAGSANWEPSGSRAPAATAPGLARHLAAGGVEVAEVIRPNRQARRRRGKSDTADAVAAALAALNGEASGHPEVPGRRRGVIRALQVARRSAVKASTQAANQLRDLIVTAPQVLRAQLGALSTRQRVALAARFRPGDRAEPLRGTKQAMAILARRYQRLQAEITELDTALDELVARAAPALLAARASPPTAPRRC